MPKIRIVADDKIPFLVGVLEPYADVVYLPGEMIDKKSVSEADVLLIRTRTRCSAELLKGTRVRFIATATIGYDHIDTVYCESHNIHWTNAPGCNSSSVQQYMAAALIRLADHMNIQLRGKSIGIIGVGNVGAKVEHIAKAFGMKPVLNDPPRARNEAKHRFVPIEVLMTGTDIISLHVPLYRSGKDKTLNLIESSLIRIMKPGAVLINTSRGEVIHTPSLHAALDEGKISTAILDVWENEPAIDLKLMQKVLIATPHIAGYSADGKANGTAMIVHSLSREFGLPLEGWYPSGLPLPGCDIIDLDGGHKSEEDILREVIPLTYSIMDDDRRLRSDPSGFEQQRKQYPPRREFPAFTIRTRNCDPSVNDLLKGLGFQTIQQ